MTTPLLSIIVPIYKVQPYLSVCLDSLINQQDLENAEFILIDDGSPDECGAICDAYASRDERFRVLHKTNAGVSAARNSGLELARGSYITFLDGDDFIGPRTYADNLAILQQDPNIDLLQFPYIFQYGRNENQPILGQVDRVIPGWQNFFYAWQTEGMTISNGWCNKIVRRALIGSTRFRSDLQGGEDGIFLLDLLSRLKVSRLSSLGCLYYVYRLGSYMNSPRSLKVLLDELYLESRRYALATQIPPLEGRCRQRVYLLKLQYLRLATQATSACDLARIRELLDHQPYPPLGAFLPQLRKERKVHALAHLGMAILGMHRFAWIYRQFARLR